MLALFAQAIADLFAILDINKNGEIDEKEQAHAMKTIHSLTLPAARWTSKLKGSIGEGPNQTNYSDQSSVRILSNFRNFL